MQNKNGAGQSSNQSRTIPTDYQNQFINLTYEEFLTKTNITQLIRDDYLKKHKHEIGDDLLKRTHDALFRGLPKVGKWHTCYLKDIKMISEISNKSKVAKVSPNVSKKKPIPSAQSGAVNLDIDNDTLTSSSVQPTAFQKLIVGLSYEDFLNKTNIIELMIKDHREYSGTNQVIQNDMLQDVLKACYENSRLYHCWPFSPLKDIRFKHPLDGDDTPKTNDRPGPNESMAKKQENEPTNNKSIKYIPTQFQLDISKLSIDEFEKRTNIRYLIEYGPNGFFTAFPKKKAIPAEVYRKNLNIQHKFALNTRGFKNWSKGFLKDLTWKAPRNDATELESLQSGLSEATGVTVIHGSHTKKITNVPEIDPFKPDDAQNENEKVESRIHTPEIQMSTDEKRQQEIRIGVPECELQNPEDRADKPEDETEKSEKTENTIDKLDSQMPEHEAQHEDVIDKPQDEVQIPEDRIEKPDYVNDKSLDIIGKSCSEPKCSTNQVSTEPQSNLTPQPDLYQKPKISHIQQKMYSSRNNEKTLVLNPANIAARLVFATVANKAALARKDVDHEKNQNTEIRKVANLFDLPMHIETAKVSELASNVVPEESVIKNEMVENVVEPQHLDSLSSLSESVKSCKDEEEADMNKSTLKKNETSPRTQFVRRNRSIINSKGYETINPKRIRLGKENKVCRSVMIQTISTATAEIGIQCELLLPPTLETESSSQSMQNVQATSTPNIQENSINFVPVCMSETTNSEPIQMQTDDDPFASINTPKYKSVGNPSMIYDLMQQMKSQPSQMDSTPTLSFTTDESADNEVSLQASCVEDHASDRLELIGLSPYSHGSAVSIDSMEERLQEMHNSPPADILTPAEIKKEFSEPINDTQGSDVMIVELAPEQPILIEEDMNTEDIFQLMSTDHSEQRKDDKIIEHVSDTLPDILLTTTNQQNMSPLHQDWLNSAEYQRFKSQNRPFESYQVTSPEIEKSYFTENYQANQKESTPQIVQSQMFFISSPNKEYFTVPETSIPPLSTSNSLDKSLLSTSIISRVPHLLFNDRFTKPPPPSVPKQMLLSNKSKIQSSPDIEDEDIMGSSLRRTEINDIQQDYEHINKYGRVKKIGTISNTSPAKTLISITTTTSNDGNIQTKNSQRTAKKQKSKLTIVDSGRKSKKVRLDQTQVPKFNYEPLQYVANTVQKRQPMTTDEQSTVGATSIRINQNAEQSNARKKQANKEIPATDSPEINIEFSDTPPNVTNPLEYLIEEDTSSQQFDKSNEDSSGTNRSTSDCLSNTKKLLNTQESVFLSSQLLSDLDQAENQKSPTSQFVSKHAIAPSALKIVLNRIEDNVDDEIPATPPNRNICILKNTDNIDETTIETPKFSNNANSPSSSSSKNKMSSPAQELLSLNTQRTLRSTTNVQASQSMVINNISPNNNTNEVHFNNCLYDQSTDTDTISDSANKHFEQTNQAAFKQIIITGMPQHRPLPSLLPIQLIKNSSQLTHNRFEFLNYIDIKEVQIQLNLTSKERILNLCNASDGFQTKLNFNVSGHHRIILNGESTRKLLKLSDIEWSAIQEILNYIRTFTYDSFSNEPFEDSILHRCLYYFFKTASRFSTAIVERYDENGDNIYTYSSTLKLPKKKRTDVKNVIDPYVLSQMNVEVKRAGQTTLYKN